MDKSIAQSLTGLVPTLNTPLPSELLELAASLLAQSRSKASSLKAEEEIARSYACANIACERLKQTLGLPKIQPRPPCPPKVYQKLYKHLDTALTVGTRRRERNTVAKVSEALPRSSPSKPRTPAKPTPSKPITPQSRQSRKTTIAPDIPTWVMPTIRHLCTSLDARTAPPHVFAGVSSILLLPAPFNPYTRTETSQSLNPDKILSLIIAVYLLVRARLLGVETPASEYCRQKDLAVANVRTAEALQVEEDNIHDADIDQWMREIRNQGWAELDWFKNIGQGTGLNSEILEEDQVMSNGDMEGLQETMTPIKKTVIDDDENNNITLLAGLGTMMQDRVDYLSDARRLDYLQWRKHVLSRIDELEHGQEMVTSAS
ncbi:hypothetical protein MMC12_004591 [Toensbergia leucococca]|nr:hypothetical protein [Toensbergia leucococca]